MKLDQCYLLMTWVVLFSRCFLTTEASSCPRLTIHLFTLLRHEASCLAWHTLLKQRDIVVGLAASTCCCFLQATNIEEKIKQTSRHRYRLQLPTKLLGHLCNICCVTLLSDPSPASSPTPPKLRAHRPSPRCPTAALPGSNGELRGAQHHAAMCH